MRNSRIVFASFGLVSSLFVLGCGSKDNPAAPCTPFDYTKYTPTSTTVTLTQVEAIIKMSCANATTCHGANTKMMGQHEPQLGPITGAMTPMELQAIHDAIVGVMAKEAPMNYVTAGDPEHSWLMKKIEASQNCAGVTCIKIAEATSACGDSMPQMSDQLPADKIQVFRDWIKAGAPAM